MLATRAESGSHMPSSKDTCSHVNLLILSEMNSSLWGSEAWLGGFQDVLVDSSQHWSRGSGVIQGSRDADDRPTAVQKMLRVALSQLASAAPCRVPSGGCQWVERAMSKPAPRLWGKKRFSWLSLAAESLTPASGSGQL